MKKHIIRQLIVVISFCIVLLSLTFRVAAQSEAAKADVRPQEKDPKELPGDPRVRIALRKLKLNFGVTKLGNYNLIYKLPESGRQQEIFISSATDKFGVLETRKIWSTIGVMDKPLSKDMANKILMNNTRNKIGRYELVYNEDNKKYILSFAVMADVEAHPTVLREIIRIVFVLADRKEEEWFKKDLF
ncbi:hypothetical protein ACFLS1_02760 [Verrucomicrobiota bacterium]